MTDQRRPLTKEEHLRVAAHVAKLDQILAEARQALTPTEHDDIIDRLIEMLDDLKTR